MSTLLDSLAAQFHGDVAQRRPLDAALRDGLPGPRTEAWKYTPLRALDRRAFDTVVDTDVLVDETLIADIPAPRLVFVNGRFDDTLSDTSALQTGVTLDAGTIDRGTPAAMDALTVADVFTRVNYALAATGVTLRVDSGTDVEMPLHLVFIGAPSDADRAWHLRHSIDVADDATLTVVEHHIAAGEHRHFDNTTVRVEVGARATLRHARVQAGSTGATSVLRTDATLQDAARYERIDLELGAALSRHELNVRLEGTAAHLTANGVLLAAGKRHVDTRLGIEHVARDTTCELLWRGIAADRGRAVFHGGITIHKGADGSDALLSNKNLLIGNDAEIDTQPVLVINADEVKAAHGATVGQLDPNAIFYLRSRGLPEDAARRLLTIAFVREPLGVIASPELRDALQAHVDRALGALPVD